MCSRIIFLLLTVYVIEVLLFAYIYVWFALGYKLLNDKALHTS